MEEFSLAKWIQQMGCLIWATVNTHVNLLRRPRSDISDRSQKVLMMVLFAATRDSLEDSECRQRERCNGRMLTSAPVSTKNPSQKCDPGCRKEGLWWGQKQAPPSLPGRAVSLIRRVHQRKWARSRATTCISSVFVMIPTYIRVLLRWTRTPSR